MSKSNQKEYRDNMTDEQEQKQREAIRQYQKKYRDNMTDEQKQKRREDNRRYQKKYRDNMSDEQKQKQRLSNRLSKKILCSKKLNNDNKIINDNDKIIDDNDNKIIDDNDFYCISIIIKLKKIVPIKDINSILKINKKVRSQVYLEEC